MYSIIKIYINVLQIDWVGAGSEESQMWSKFPTAATEVLTWLILS